MICQQSQTQTMDDRNKFCCILWIFIVFFCYMFVCRSQSVLVISRWKDGRREQSGGTLLADERGQRGQRHHVSRCLRCVCSTSAVMSLLLSICCTCGPHVVIAGVWLFHDSVTHHKTALCFDRLYLWSLLLFSFDGDESISYKGALIPTPWTDLLRPSSSLFFLDLT